MYRNGKIANKCRIIYFLTIMVCMLSLGITSFICARKASADSDQPKEKQVSQESVYTIQTGTFKDRQIAEKQFRFIERSLEGTALQALRIEMIGSLYAVRVGRFARHEEAEQFMREHELIPQGAMVMKAHFIDERILLIRDGVISKNDIKDFDYYHRLGLAYGKEGSYQEAIDAYKEAIRIKPDADAYRDLGFIYSDLGKYQEAIDVFKKAIRIKPDFADTHYSLGVACNDIGRHQDAVVAYKEAIRIKPDFADAHYNLGITYGYLHKYHEASDAYKEAIRIKPDFADAHYNLGIAYLMIDDKVSSLDEYKILKDLDKELANKLFNVINQ
ncbi:MAG: tetratricopeptide repeat protein [Nitrospiraceae bacterium]|nr:MAG: tetratricopeptide repeat protein [Nitrospiraceae bacterium]